MKIYSTEYHVTFGWHSNIPSCCIQAFIRHEPTVEKPIEVGYRRCDKCVKNNVLRRVHICRSGEGECEKFLSLINAHWENKRKEADTK